MFLSRYALPLQSVLRFVAGLLFIEHGTQKILHFPPMPAMMAAQIPPRAVPILMVAGIIEMIGGFLIAIGFYSRWVAFICSGEMAIAYWGVHFLRGGPFPANNAGDAAILFCFVFLYLAAAGPGPYAVNEK